MNLFTTAELAAALGRSREAMRQRLIHVHHGGQKIVSGNAANAYAIATLPGDLQKELNAVARERGCRNAEHMLSAPQPAWEPPISLAEWPQAALEVATKRRDVFLPFLECKDNENRSQAEFEEAGRAAYQRVFGHSISGTGFRYLYDTFIERDADHRDFIRPEIYFSKKGGRKNAAPARPAKYDFQPIADAIACLDDKAMLTAEDRSFIFDSAFRHLEALAVNQPGKQNEIARATVSFLWSVLPSLSTSKGAMAVMFARKLALWRQNGRCPAAIEDLRRTKSGNFRRPDFKVDMEKIRTLAIVHGGNESLAHRLLRQRGELSKEFCEYYPFDARTDKSRVPAAVREDITPEVEMCGPIHRGPWEAKMRGPYIQRDWTGVKPGEWFNADDVTWNSYFWFRDDAGELQITRGECLLFIDLRTGYPLDFTLISAKYNSAAIRRAILRVHDLHGLPHNGFYFEQGVWKSRLITGETNKNLIHWRDAERGLRDYGLDMDVRHATTPRAKIIEGFLHVLQDRQRNEIGFVGFNERLEKMERIQDVIGRCKRGTEDPRNHFLSQEQWRDRISQCLNEYLADPQNGKMLDGMTPAQMWAQRQPLRKLPDDARYLLATHRVRAKVRQEGIILKIRGKRLAFYNEETGKRIGRDVFAFYNIEQPDLLTVSDLDRKDFFTVKNHTLPAMSATKEQFAAVNKDRAGHMGRAKEIYGAIRHPQAAIVPPDTDIITAPDIAALGEFHNAATERHQQEQTAVVDARHSRHKRGLQLLRETSPTGLTARESNAPKIYILDPTPAAAPTVAVYWALWAKVEKMKPGISRHALTAKAIGCHPKPQEMTPAQLSKIIEVFSAIIRDAKVPAAAT